MVEVGFLTVGHTHTDINQTFNTTSQQLDKHDVITLKTLHSVLSNIYNDHKAAVWVRQSSQSFHDNNISDDYQALCKWPGKMLSMFIFTQSIRFPFHESHLTDFQVP